MNKAYPNIFSVYGAFVPEKIWFQNCSKNVVLVILKLFKIGELTASFAYLLQIRDTF